MKIVIVGRILFSFPLSLSVLLIPSSLHSSSDSPFPSLSRHRCSVPWLLSLLSSLRRREPCPPPSLTSLWFILRRSRSSHSVHLMINQRPSSNTPQLASSVSATGLSFLCLYLPSNQSAGPTGTGFGAEAINLVHTFVPPVYRGKARSHLSHASAILCILTFRVLSGLCRDSCGCCHEVRP